MDRERQEKEQRDKDYADRKQKTAETLAQKVKEDMENANKYDKMMPTSYQVPDVAQLKAEPRKRKARSKKKSHYRRPPEQEESHSVNPRMEQIGEALFLKDKYKHKKQKKARPVTAKPDQKAADALKRISEEEYLRTLYPQVDYSILDMHCSREHYKEWFGEFAQKVFERSNQIKYDIFMKRCIKTSPYNDNGGQKFAMLKSLQRDRSKSAKKSYERNTIASLAKAL